VRSSSRPEFDLASPEPTLTAPLRWYLSRAGDVATVIDPGSPIKASLEPVVTATEPENAPSPEVTLMPPPLR
jgi:hypothetical protein